MYDLEPETQELVIYLLRLGMDELGIHPLNQALVETELDNLDADRALEKCFAVWVKNIDCLMAHWGWNPPEAVRCHEYGELLSFLCYVSGESSILEDSLHDFFSKISVSEHTFYSCDSTAVLADGIYHLDTRYSKTFDLEHAHSPKN